MRTSCSNQIDEPAAALSSFRGPAGDEALVLAAKNGNEQAFEILVERYRRRMLAVALRLKQEPRSH